MVVKPNAPAGQEKVIRVPKEKLADYKSKGYVEAESYIPEAKKVKEEELTAGQKKLPPALQKAIEKKQKNEEAEITETEGGSGGGIDALRAIKGKRQRLQQELDALNKDDTNYKEKAANLRGQIEKQKEIMASKQKEVYGSYDPSREDALDLNEITDEEVETVEEAAGANQLTNLNDKITRLQVNISKLDKSKPESKTKEAILKSDLTTAKLRLQDLMQKRNTETEKPMNEAKKTYKSIKKSVKKEEETPKKTMTDKPLTKIDVDPKITSN
jgi:chromosome segregation ATPase